MIGKTTMKTTMAMTTTTAVGSEWLEFGGGTWKIWAASLKDTEEHLGHVKENSYNNSRTILFSKHLQTVELCLKHWWCLSN